MANRSMDPISILLKGVRNGRHVVGIRRDEGIECEANLTNLQFRLLLSLIEAKEATGVVDLSRTIRPESKDALFQLVRRARVELSRNSFSIGWDIIVHSGGTLYELGSQCSIDVATEFRNFALVSADSLFLRVLRLIDEKSRPR